MNAESALRTVAFGSLSLDPIPENLLLIQESQSSMQKTKLLMPLTKSALTLLLSVAWTHNPYASPSLWKTGCRNYKQLNLNNLYTTRLRKRVQKMAKNGQKSVVFRLFSAVFGQKQQIFTGSLLH